MAIFGNAITPNGPRETGYDASKNTHYQSGETHYRERCGENASLSNSMRVAGEDYSNSFDYFIFLSFYFKS